MRDTMHNLYIIAKYKASYKVGYTNSKILCIMTI